MIAKNREVYTDEKFETKIVFEAEDVIKMFGGLDLFEKYFLILSYSKQNGCDFGEAKESFKAFIKELRPELKDLIRKKALIHARAEGTNDVPSNIAAELYSE